MKQGKLLSVAFAAMLAILALGATSAMAANPKILDEKAEFSSTSGLTQFGSGLLTVKSGKGKGSGKGTSEKGGEFTNLFEESKDLLGRKCTGLSDATAGNVTVSGKFEVRYWGLSEGNKDVVILFKLNPVHFSCGTTLAVVTGCVTAQLALPYNKLVKELEAKLVVAGGDNVPVKVDNAANTAEENCELRVEFNEEGTTSLSSEEGVEKISGFKNSLGKAKDEVEVVA
jgi:hypothetical protein